MSRFNNRVQIKLESADPLRIIKVMSDHGIIFFDLTTDDICINTGIQRKHLSKAEQLAKKNGAKLIVPKQIGKESLFVFWRHHPLLLFGVLLLVLFTWLASGRILFIQVEGNATIPSQQILEQARSCGVRFGASRRKIRSEQVKNQLLSAVPELQWIGVNMTGCTATVQVRERESIGEIRHRYGNVVASADGVIVNMTVMKGTALCQPGQAVKEGQTLVSGYSDRGFKLEATGAEAEVLAQTRRRLSVISPAAMPLRGEIRGIHTCYSLLIGKKIINFSKDSGICDTTCVKMYREDYLTLPGGFSLPVALITLTCTEYEVVAEATKTMDSGEQMRKLANKYLLEQMVAGQVLSDSTYFYNDQEWHCLTGDYICLEMIGQVDNKERILNNG